ncbi:MAG TPA: cache domain-containing protein, partial [Herpetosiphonaceae bacterium]
LVAVRNQATTDSSEALQAQAEQYLLRVAQANAASTGQTLRAVQQLAVITRGYLQQPDDSPAPLPELQVARNGRRYTNGATTILVPAEADEGRARSDLLYGQRLEQLLPSLQAPEIVRISYLTESTLRTYPNIAPNDPPADWLPTSEAAWQASLPEQNPSRAPVLTGIHPSIDQAESLVSAVAPVYVDGDFAGTVSVDVSLERLTAYLSGLIVDRSGFAFLTDSAGKVVVTTAEGQQALPGQLLPDAAGTPGSEADSATLAPIFDALTKGRSGVASATLRGRGYVLAYAPISGPGWGLVLAAPLDEITARTEATAGRIAGITNQSLALALGLALLSVIAIAVGMTILLRRQLVQPLTALISATDAVAAGKLQPLEITSQNELGQLATSFNTMTTALKSARAETEAKEAAREEAMRDLSQVVASLEQALAERQQLSQMLGETTSPVIPVIKGVLVMPLIGNLDQQRIDLAMTVLLRNVERERAHTVLIDVTGVPIIDTLAAQGLQTMVDSIQLLGAVVVLVGVGPEVAQMLVS